MTTRATTRLIFQQQTQVRSELQQLCDLKSDMLTATAEFLKDTTKKVEYSSKIRDIGMKIGKICDGKQSNSCC